MQWMILPFKRYADFQGRSRRLEFWMFNLLNLIVAAVLAAPFFAAIFTASYAAADDPSITETAIFEQAMTASGGLALAGLGLYGIYVLAAFIPSLAVTVRRLHDRDMSGWWYLGLVVGGLLPFVGVIASIALLVLMLLPGTPGANRFGPDPKDPHSAEVFA